MSETTLSLDVEDWNSAVVDTWPLSPPRLVRQSGSFLPPDSPTYGDFSTIFDLYDKEKYTSSSSLSPSKSKEDSVDSTETVVVPSPKPSPRPAPPQFLNENFVELLSDNISKEQALESFQKLAQELIKLDIGDCRAYHSTLNDWLSARLSRVTAAQMMVRFFANDKQICYIFQEISDPNLINRHVRSCVRNHKRLRYLSDPQNTRTVLFLLYTLNKTQI